MGPKYYDRQGKPMSLMEWARRMEEREYKRVASTSVPPNVEVSTVWLGLDHQWGAGPPLIFETMVFGGALDREIKRYSTEEQALAGHEAMVQRARAAKPN